MQHVYTVHVCYTRAWNHCMYFSFVYRINEVHAEIRYTHYVVHRITVCTSVCGAYVFANDVYFISFQLFLENEYFLENEDKTRYHPMSH